MNNMTTQPCRFCLDASCDPTGTLTEENDYSSISVGRTISSLKEYEPINSYNISIESGRGKPLRIAVTSWNEYGRNGHEVGVYEPKFCPNVGGISNEMEVYMKRFTERVVNECGSFVMGLCEACPTTDDRGCDYQCLQAALTFLAAYEDTGLTPEEIMKLKHMVNKTPTNGKRSDYVHYDFDTIEEATEI